MENANLESILLLVNLMMNVNRGFDELASQFNDDIIFLEDEDADEYFEFQTEFDFSRELFHHWEAEFEGGHPVNMMEIDMIANYIDLVRHYLGNISNTF